MVSHYSKHGLLNKSTFSGLRTLLNSQQSEYLDFTSRSGFVVTVHEHDAQGFPMDLGTYVPVGFVTSLGVELVN